MSLIPGKPLLGFWDLFEAAYGDPETESPMRVVTPSFVGRSMLPFRCPRCQSVPQDLACPHTRERYRDRRPGRGNHFCPLCGCRFRINEDGVPLRTPLAAGAEVGPSIVTLDGVEAWQDAPDEGILATVLGAVFGATAKRASGRSNYASLLAHAFDETISSPTRVVINPQRGGSTVFASPVSVSVSGGTRSAPSYARGAVFFSTPKTVLVRPASGAPQTFRDPSMLQVYEGKSSLS